MSNLEQAVRGAVQANATQLANAGTPADVEQIVPAIIKDAERIFTPHTDRRAYLMVIIILGIVIVGVLIVYGIHTLTPDRAATATQAARTMRNLPEALIALGSVAIGALAGILAPGPRGT